MVRLHPKVRQGFLPLGFLVSYVGFASAQTGYIYQLDSEYSGANFFSGWDFFTDPDLTGGFVTYYSQSSAQLTGLINASANAPTYIGADHTNISPNNGAGRPSVRISTQKSWTHGLFIGDFAHTPGGICGTWPAFWTVAPNWPNNGEIDIMEGVNLLTQNAVSLHTNVSCTIAGDSRTETGILQGANCAIYPGGGNSQGCGVLDTRSTSYGTGFNAAGGGVYAMQWTSEYIRVWVFTRDSIPADIINLAPNPSGWGLPAANMQGSCPIDTHFQQHQIVLDNTFCGSYAGAASVWNFSQNSCAISTGYSDCDLFVAANPNAFKNAYWMINSVRVYQLVVGTNLTYDTPYIASLQPTSVSSYSTSATPPPTPTASLCPTYNFTVIQSGLFQYEIECGYNPAGSDLGAPYSNYVVRTFEDCVAGCSYWNMYNGSNICGAVAYNIGGSCYWKRTLGPIAKDSTFNGARMIYYAYPQVTDNPNIPSGTMTATTTFMQTIVTPQYYRYLNATESTSSLISAPQTTSIVGFGMGGAISTAQNVTTTTSTTPLLLEWVVSTIPTLTTTPATSASTVTVRSMVATTPAQTTGTILPSTSNNSPGRSPSTALTTTPSTSSTPSKPSNQFSGAMVSPITVSSGKSPSSAPHSYTSIQSLSSSTSPQFSTPIASYPTPPSISNAATTAPLSAVDSALPSSSSVGFTGPFLTTTAISTNTSFTYLLSSPSATLLGFSDMPASAYTSDTALPTETFPAMTNWAPPINAIPSGGNGDATLTAEATVTATPTVQPPTLDGFRYRGCLGSKSGLSGFYQVEDSIVMSISQCISDCFNSAYAGLASTICLCGDSTAAVDGLTTFPDTECNVPCPGDPTQICGGVVSSSSSFIKRQAATLSGGEILLTVYENELLVPPNAGSANVSSSTIPSTLNSAISASIPSTNGPPSTGLSSSSPSTISHSLNSIIPAQPAAVSSPAPRPSSTLPAIGGDGTSLDPGAGDGVRTSVSSSSRPVKPFPVSGSYIPSFNYPTVVPFIVSTMWIDICDICEHGITQLATTVTVMHCGCTESVSQSMILPVAPPCVPMTTLVEECACGEGSASSSTTLTVPCSSAIAKQSSSVAAAMAAWSTGLGAHCPTPVPWPSQEIAAGETYVVNSGPSSNQHLEAGTHSVSESENEPAIESPFVAPGPGFPLTPTQAESVEVPEMTNSIGFGVFLPPFNNVSASTAQPITTKTMTLLYTEGTHSPPVPVQWSSMPPSMISQSSAPVFATKENGAERYSKFSVGVSIEMWLSGTAIVVLFL